MGSETVGPEDWMLWLSSGYNSLHILFSGSLKWFFFPLLLFLSAFCTSCHSSTSSASFLFRLLQIWSALSFVFRQADDCLVLGEFVCLLPAVCCFLVSSAQYLLLKLAKKSTPFIEPDAAFLESHEVNLSGLFMQPNKMVFGAATATSYKAISVVPHRRRITDQGLCFGPITALPLSTSHSKPSLAVCGRTSLHFDQAGMFAD